MRARKEGSALWHIWMDKPGRSHKLAELDGSRIVCIDTGEVWPAETADEIVQVVTQNRLYVGCQDLHKIPAMSDLLRRKGVHELLSRSQGLVGITIRGAGAHHGVLIPTDSFVKQPMDWARVIEYFDLMGYEGNSLGAVTEKLFRSTLPPNHGITRVAHGVRRHFMSYGFGARVHQSRLPYHADAFEELDFNQAYLHQARRIPVLNEAPDFEKRHDIDIDRWPAYIHAIVSVPQCDIGVLPIFGPDGGQRWPHYGNEVIDGWWWKEELQDAENAGYKILKIRGAWVWNGYTDCMNAWADMMLDKLNQVQNDPVLKHMIKTSYTALPGRFQMRPEKHELISIDDADEGDIPLLLNFSESGFSSDFAIRSQPFLDSTALVPQGNYIVMQQRRALYKLMKQCSDLGVPILLANTDCVYIPYVPEQLVPLIGTKDGQLKHKSHTHGGIYLNRVVSDQGWKLPGVTGIRRERVAEELSVA